MNFLNKLFGRKPKEELRIYVNAYGRTPEQEAMHKEQVVIQGQLGMEHGDNTQNWLRLHQILIDYEERLKILEDKLIGGEGGRDTNDKR
jgi:hypothetical protein